MEQPYDVRELTKGENNREKALAMGERMGAMVAAEVLTQPACRAVTHIIKAGEEFKLELYEQFYNAFVQTFQLLMSTEIKGVEARSALSSDFMRHAADARREASKVAVEATSSKDMSKAPEIERMLMAANEAVDTANKLFAPVQTNLLQLIGTARNTETLSQMQRNAAAALSGHVQCSNPDCPNCQVPTNH